MVKAMRLITKSEHSDKYMTKVQAEGAKVVMAIERACEKDKALSNLKGKAKEIKAIIAMV
jgi:hypothetical protein